MATGGSAASSLSTSTEMEAVSSDTQLATVTLKVNSSTSMLAAGILTTVAATPDCAARNVARSSLRVDDAPVAVSSHVYVMSRPPPPNDLDASSTSSSQVPMRVADGSSAATGTMSTSGPCSGMQPELDRMPLRTTLTAPALSVNDFPALQDDGVSSIRIVGYAPNATSSVRLSVHPQRAVAPSSVVPSWNTVLQKRTPALSVSSADDGVSKLTMMAAPVDDSLAPVITGGGVRPCTEVLPVAV
mmetsp:Transcript_13964/g.48656  ORF Transcript_13964/g.48656 Transcript_13964/m.48656 type:complete len:244 (-) Transcript_13964:2864-3595(-)